VLSVSPLPDDRPQGARLVVEVVAHREQASRPLAPRQQPPVLFQRLQVTADRGLRELHDARDLPDRQLLDLKQPKQPRSLGDREVREAGAQPSAGIGHDVSSLVGRSAPG
jgi:hypothetical protein